MAIAGGWCRGQLLGRGSSATVSLATAVASGDVFAVKSAPLSRSAALRKEQSILSSLSSPYVVPCLGFQLSGSSYDLFLEYAPGGSLADEMKRRGGRLDEAAVGFFLCDVLRGLAYLHSRGVVHCDVKVQNVLIGSDGRAKVADFGCARFAGEDEERAQFGGTPMFMAPEVARGEEQGAPADVWALGCTAVEMATGQAPWPQVADPVGALHRIAFSEDVPEFPSWFSDDGKDFLSRCLRRDPSQRWTAEQLLEHPFVSAAAAYSHSKASASGDFWVSPKSTLDQAFWESLSEEEDDDVEQLTEKSAGTAAEMFHQLMAVGAGAAPNWTWDEDWMTVRGHIPESRRAMEDAIPGDLDIQEDSIGSSGEAFTDSTSRNDINDGLITFNTNHMITSTNYNLCASTSSGIANAAQLEERNVQQQQLQLPNTSCKLLINYNTCGDDALDLDAPKLFLSSDARLASSFKSFTNACLWPFALISCCLDDSKR